MHSILTSLVLLYLVSCLLFQSAVNDDMLLNQAERYKKLKEVSALLQEAREAQASDRAGDYTSEELKDQIRTALEEAVRLRAETESLYNKVCV